MPISLLVWVRSFIEPDLFDNVSFDNTTPIYAINLPWKLGLEFHGRQHRAKRTYPFNQQQNEIIYSMSAYE